MTKPNLICATGLLPYLTHFLYTRSFVSCVVFCNGILFHVISPNTKFVKWYDIVSNGVMIIYVNVRVLDVYVSLWSAVAVACYFYNMCYTKQIVLANVIHVVGVQWLGLLALHLSRTRCIN